MVAEGTTFVFVREERWYNVNGNGKFLLDD